MAPRPLTGHGAIAAIRAGPVAGWMLSGATPLPSTDGSTTRSA